MKNNARYTSEAKENKVKGSVKLEFFVNTDGSLSDFVVVKPLGHGLDEEAIRFVKEGPAWKPGTRNKKPERQKVKLKIAFEGK